MSDELRDQINEIIEADIQLKINDYIEKNGKIEEGWSTPMEEEE